MLRGTPYHLWCVHVTDWIAHYYYKINVRIENSWPFLRCVVTKLLSFLQKHWLRSRWNQYWVDYKIQCMCGTWIWRKKQENQTVQTKGQCLTEVMSNRGNIWLRQCLTEAMSDWSSVWQMVCFTKAMSDWRNVWKK